MHRRHMVRVLVLAPLCVRATGAPAPASAAERLLGTWRSDAERTVAHWQFKEGATPAIRSRVAAWFGKLTITFSRARVTTEFEGTHFESKYRVLRQTESSVTVEYTNDGKPEVETIYLGEGFIFKRVGPSANFEYFRRVAA